MDQIKGRISSLHSLSALDGPGLRAVVFLQGCPLRCVYCHNPETWEKEGGEEYTAGRLREKLSRFYPYIKSGGGVTLSGGEPLFQPEFAASLLSRLKADGIHTALDTSGMCDIKKAADVLTHTDLVICDLKFADASDYKKYTGGDIRRVLDFLSLTRDMGQELWIRHTVLPRVTDNPEYIAQLLGMARGYGNLTRFEVLPFRKMCEVKYNELGIPFPLTDTPEMDGKQAEELLAAAKRLTGGQQ